MMLIIALALLVLVLLFVIAMLRGDVRRVRAELRRERMLARIFQEIAHDERDRGDAWMERALYPETGKTLWEAIDEWLEKERER